MKPKYPPIQDSHTVSQLLKATIDFLNQVPDLRRVLEIQHRIFIYAKKSVRMRQKMATFHPDLCPAFCEGVGGEFLLLVRRADGN